MCSWKMSRLGFPIRFIPIHFDELEQLDLQLSINSFENVAMKLIS